MTYHRVLLLEYLEMLLMRQTGLYVEGGKD